MSSNLAKVLITAAAAVPCSVCIWLTHGEHGIGWFFVIFLLVMMATTPRLDKPAKPDNKEAGTEP